MAEVAPEPLLKIGAVVLGAAAAGAVSGLVRKVVPVGAEIAGAIGGGLMYWQGERIHPLVKWAGIGVLAGSVAPAIAKHIPAVGEGGGGGGSQEAPEDVLKILAEAEAAKEV